MWKKVSALNWLISRSVLDFAFSKGVWIQAYDEKTIQIMIPLYEIKHQFYQILLYKRHSRSVTTCSDENFSQEQHL